MFVFDADRQPHKGWVDIQLRTSNREMGRHGGSAVREK
jgi:hypothetical protein